MKNNLAREISGALKLRDVMEHYGVKFNNRGFAKCPFHNEKTASLTIKNEHYKCFGCGAYGGVIDFVMMYYGINFRSALVKLNSDFSLGLIKNKTTGFRERLDVVDNQKLQKAVIEWKSELHSEYLTLCEVHSILYRRYLNGEVWLEELLNSLVKILDSFNDEEARFWLLWKSQ